jgi:hypothetical protein
VRASAIRIDAPQYGVVLQRRRINARLAEGTITLDELSLAGGADALLRRERLRRRAPQLRNTRPPRAK